MGRTAGSWRLSGFRSAIVEPPVAPADLAGVLGGDEGHSAAANAIERDLAMAGGARQCIEFDRRMQGRKEPWEPAGLNELTPGSSEVAAIAPIVVAGVTGIGVELVRRAADEASSPVTSASHRCPTRAEAWTAIEA